MYHKLKKMQILAPFKVSRPLPHLSELGRAQPHSAAPTRTVRPHSAALSCIFDQKTSMAQNALNCLIRREMQ